MIRKESVIYRMKYGGRTITNRSKTKKEDRETDIYYITASAAVTYWFMHTLPRINTAVEK